MIRECWIFNWPPSSAGRKSPAFRFERKCSKTFHFSIKIKKISGWTVTVGQFKKFKSNKSEKIKIWFCFPSQAINGCAISSSSGTGQREIVALANRIRTRSRCDAYRGASSRNLPQLRSNLVKQIWWVSFLIFTIMKAIRNYRERESDGRWYIGDVLKFKLYIIVLAARIRI